MNNMHEREGVVKYSCRRIDRPISQVQGLMGFFGLRKKLFIQKLIGEDQEGLGYGNISMRVHSSPRFLITGSQTSGLEDVSGQQLAEVLTVDIEKNFLTFAGSIQASSESMTHAALYQVDPNIKGIAHVHSSALWEQYRDRLPTTHHHVAYGTPEMAYEMIRLYRRKSTAIQGVIVLAGHRDGIIAYGPSLEVAVQQILDLKVS